MDLRDILDFSHEEGEELRRIYGPVPQTWDEVGSWDDCVIPEEKAITSNLKEERAGCEQCPYLRTKGSYFMYCGVRSDSLLKTSFHSANDEIPNPNSAEYNAKVDHFSLQLWCMHGEERHGKCVSFISARAKE